MRAPAGTVLAPGATLTGRAPGRDVAGVPGRAGAHDSKHQGLHDPEGLCVGGGLCGATFRLPRTDVVRQNEKIDRERELLFGVNSKEKKKDDLKKKSKCCDVLFIFLINLFFFYK